MNDEWKGLARRLDELLGRVERLLPGGEALPDWKAHAYRWRKNARGGYLEAVKHPHTIRFEDLKDVDEQKRRLRENTAQFVAGRHHAVQPLEEAVEAIEQRLPVVHFSVKTRSQ